MSSATNAFENALVDWLFRGRAFTLAGATAALGSGPTTLHVALFTTPSTDVSGGTEVTGTGYTRVPVPCNITNWAATDSPDSTAATSSGTSGTTSNNVAITFGLPTSNWGTIPYFGIYTSSTAGTCIFQGPLSTPITVNSGDPTPSFPAGSLQIVLD